MEFYLVEVGSGILGLLAFEIIVAFKGIDPDVGLLVFHKNSLSHFLFLTGTVSVSRLLFHRFLSDVKLQPFLFLYKSDISFFVSFLVYRA